MMMTYLILIVVIVNEAIVGVEIVFGREHAGVVRQSDTHDQQTYSNKQQHLILSISQNLDRNVDFLIFLRFGGE